MFVRSVRISLYHTRCALERGPACHPERSEGSLRPARRTLHCAQGDIAQGESPNVYLKLDIFVIDMTSRTRKEPLLMDEPLVSDVALPSMHMELPEALREPTRSKNLLFMALYTVANMVIGVS